VTSGPSFPSLGFLKGLGGLGYTRDDSAKPLLVGSVFLGLEVPPLTILGKAAGLTTIPGVARDSDAL
jgi:hypothetical protein